MHKNRLLRLLLTLLIGSAGAFLSPAEQADAQQDRDKREQSSMSPQQAAQKAKAKHGGKVLKVTPKGKGYRVKLLQDSGRVVTVTVKD